MCVHHLGQIAKQHCVSFLSDNLKVNEIKDAVIQSSHNVVDYYMCHMLFVKQ